MDENTFYKVINRISDYMDVDSYNRNGKFYQISNLYYDSQDDMLIRNSIEKPIYKEKLRLRSYGTPDEEDRVFLEIKKKYKNIVNKRRVSIKLSDAYQYMAGERNDTMSDPQINQQVLREISYFKDFYHVVPKVYLSYDRKAYFSKNDSDFRVTFDTNIVTRRNELRLEYGSYGTKLLNDGIYLMEIKINKAVPLWFVNIISEFNIYPVSFSKYGTEYKNYILQGLMQNNSIKGEQLCLNQFFQVQQQKMPSILAQQC
jgi:hypothetical protein